MLWVRFVYNLVEKGVERSTVIITSVVVTRPIMMGEKR